MIIAFPIILIFNNPILAYNIILLFSFILSGYSMFLLIDYYITDKQVSFVGGIAFAFCTVRFAHLGHLQLLTVQWLPLCLLYLDRFLHKGDHRSLILLYIFYVLQILSSWYLAFYATISLVIYALLVTLTNKVIYKNLFTIRHVLMIILFVVSVGLVVTPFAFALFSSFSRIWPCKIS